ncbi:ATP-binding protein [Maribacter cobaltidurans]|uniref:histidine kinase n=1 Tax=Maribacter cobaltidurans TaxID=1178778 RepID=A0A223VBH1_9FLAO|nr:ATP-binding protein [Maribacter cobaltidurans]ASV32189.1 hypothetical protein CJ263_19255 [Maribacter cobaltidurans]GGD91041.1 hypothetical protein GCM10011412_31270 [Maribacter cobaltidurans]
MNGVKTENLQNQLKHLESTLSSFSFESLNATEAITLKSSFKAFKGLMEAKIYNPEMPLDMDATHKVSNEVKEEGNVLSKETSFIAHISHEIRTPLNGIIGFTNLLREDNLNESQTKKVNAIHIASQNLLEIINEVLEYSKLSSGIEDFIEIDFNLSGLINDVVFLCQTLLVDRKIDLQLKIDKRIPATLIGDPSKLSQILLNLLGNSIKFVEKGFIRLEIFLKDVSQDQHIIEFIVKDSGIGISEEQLKGIFQCFKQVDPYTSSKYGGTGLGLCIVKKLVEKQGGEISAESELGSGSTFTFTIPYKKGVSRNIPKQTLGTINILKGKELLNGTKILVFEDNHMNQHLIKEQLQKWGCKIYVTSDADKGMGILKTQTVDLILMDLRMPGLNGFQISRLIREDRQIGEIPIIAVSADFTAQDEENCIASGINDFLLKPYTLDELLKKLLKAKKQTPLSMDSKVLLGTEIITGKPNAILDLESVLEDCCGEVDVLEELIRLFKQNVYEFIGSVKINLKQGTFHEIGFAAHKLKAGLKMLKLEKLASLMVNMQQSGEAGEELKLRSMFQDFLTQYPKYEREIDKAFAKIKNEKGK